MKTAKTEDFINSKVAHHHSYQSTGGGRQQII